MLRAVAIRRAGAWSGAAGEVALDYDGRFLRRRRLVLADGSDIMADLPETVSLDHGDALVLEKGACIAVRAAPEPLLQVRGDLIRLAWHIGNRHTPCQIRSDHLLIREDRVLADMLAGLGAEVTQWSGPFQPEGGAYGHGRTLDHTHGPDEGHGHNRRRNHGQHR